MLVSTVKCSDYVFLRTKKISDVFPLQKFIYPNISAIEVADTICIKHDC